MFHGLHKLAQLGIGLLLQPLEHLHHSSTSEFCGSAVASKLKRHLHGAGPVLRSNCLPAALLQQAACCQRLKPVFGRSLIRDSYHTAGLPQGDHVRNTAGHAQLAEFVLPGCDLQCSVGVLQRSCRVHCEPR